MTDKQNPRWPGLDGVRALAVLLVILFHQKLLPCGWIGVQLFFVLSGFLITRLLFRARTQPFSQYLRTFFGRRALRIFPAYYLYLTALGALVLIGYLSPRDLSGFAFAASYTYDFYAASRWFFASHFLGHLWSLAVEEQFYLVWPIVIFFCSSSALKKLLPLLIIGGPLLRTACHVALASSELAFRRKDLSLYFLPLTHLDAFAVGGYFALFPPALGRKALAASASLTLAAGAAVLLFAPARLGWRTLGYPLGLGLGFGYVWGYSLINVTSALLIHQVSQRQFLPFLFENRAATYVGRISYGVYLLHLSVQESVARLLPHTSVWLQLALEIAVTLVLAGLSFALFESPILALKERWFPEASRAHS